MRSLLYMLLAGLHAVSFSSPQYTPPPGSPGFYHGNSSAAVTFDQHSVFLDNKRLFVFSGEFHPWRAPSGPPIWRDVLQKMKAAGYNAVSVYHHWGLVSQKAGALNFDGYRSHSAFYQVAKEVGILVIVRPGPYINAETTAGGFPGWVTNIPARLRTNTTEFADAWRPYISAVAKSAAPFQYPDGPIIAMQVENEFIPSSPDEPGRSEYMGLLEHEMRANGMDKVPLTHNEAGTRGYFASGDGMVDLYTWDVYPNNFDCSRPEVWKEVRTTLAAAHQRINPAEPWASGEFQGGSFDPWGGAGYDACEVLTNAQFSNVFYKNNYAAGTVWQNLYMTYGGTNWGNLAEPTVYTSYDYGAPIKEDRTLRPKYSEIKLQAYFLHASPELLLASPIASGDTFSNNAEVYTTLLSSPTGANFYVVRQKTNANTEPVSFFLNVNTSQGPATIPQHTGNITLDGRESKILVTNYKFGSSEVRYSTAEVLTWMTIDDIDYIVIYAPRHHSIETAIRTKRCGASLTSGTHDSGDDILLAGFPFKFNIHRTMTSCTNVVIADKETALSMWNPRVATSPASPYDIAPDVPSVLVIGPYLVRNASIVGSTLELYGDTNTTTTQLDILGPASIKRVTWNGKNIEVKPADVGTLRGEISTEIAKPKLPDLKKATWACTNSLPEVQDGYDDSTWVTANKTTTSRPFQPFSGKLVLYADEYGFHSGNTLYRGHFKGDASGVALSVQGGFNFAYSAFINSHFLFSDQGTNPFSPGGGKDMANDTLKFPPGTVKEGDNVLTVILDQTGLSEDDDYRDVYKTPRGIRGYKLLGATDVDTWKIIGNYKGEDGPDKVRGPLNEGGLFVEREGAHLPGFPTNSWDTGASCDPLSGIASAGIKAYRTTFTLDLPLGMDIPLALKFTRTPTSSYRSIIYINGWQFGRFNSKDGPQTLFPLPDGIINSRGENELLLTLWSLDAQGAKFADFELVATAAGASSREWIPGGHVDSPTFQDVRGG